MRKSSYPNLTDLSLFQNKILEGDKLTQLSGCEINMIRIEYGNGHEQIWNSEWLYKIETRRLSTLSRDGCS